MTSFWTGALSRPAALLRALAAFLSAGMLLAALPGPGAMTARAEGPHWSYSGLGGPAHWGDLSGDYETCGTGTQQSPVDLDDGVPALMPAIELNWNRVDWTVRNNGHSIVAEAENAGVSVIDGRSYALLQFHFHTPSEHTIRGRHFPMEVHFVHRDAEGQLAVIGVMMETGGNSTLFRTLMYLAPEEPGTSPAGAIDPRELIPGLDGFLRYQGSLTTPPCSETVLWTVLKTPLAVNERDIAAFARLFPMNARPVQPMHRRYLLAN